MSHHYILGPDGKTPVPASLMQWASATTHSDLRAVPGARMARVAFTRLSASVYVSTMFLGLDQRFGDGGPPLVFETMAFGLPGDEYQERFCTWEEARAGHANAVAHAEATRAASFADVEPRS